MGNLESAVELDCRRNPEQPEETHTEKRLNKHATNLNFSKAAILSSLHVTTASEDSSDAQMTACSLVPCSSNGDRNL